MPTLGPATGSGEPRPRVGPSAGRPGGPGGQASSEEGPPWHGSSPVPLGAAELGGVSVARPRLRDAMGAGQGHSSDMNLNDKGVVQNCGELRISKCCTFLGTFLMPEGCRSGAGRPDGTIRRRNSAAVHDNGQSTSANGAGEAWHTREEKKEPVGQRCTGDQRSQQQQAAQ